MCTKVIFRLIYFNRELPVTSSEACFFFWRLVELVTPRIAKKETNMKETVTTEERLAVTIRFLATGNTYSDLAFTFRMHTSTIGGIIPEENQALQHCLKSEYLRLPNT